MTNADKFLKDEKYIFDIAKGIAEAICYDDMEHAKKITEKEIRNWFTSNAKPTLTEDEKVILRNLNEQIWEKIGRDKYGTLSLKTRTKDDENFFNGCYGHLFQFIKERRRIESRGVVN